MSVVIIGGNECMSRKYTDICQEHGCKAKVFPKETGPLEKKIGSPDLMIQGAMKAAKKNSVPVARIHSSSATALRNLLCEHCPICSNCQAKAE